MDLKDRVRQRIEELGSNPAAISAKAGLNPTYVRDLLEESSVQLTLSRIESSQRGSVMSSKSSSAEKLTVSMEGIEALQGLVDARAYFQHINRLLEILGSLERAYLNTSKKKTRYLIADQKRENPFVADLVPNSMEHGYSPLPAQKWATDQFLIIQADAAPDPRVSFAILDQLTKLPPDKGELVQNFRLNGSTEVIRFDQRFKANAQRRANERREQEAIHFFEGRVLGEVTGQLLRLDALDGDHAVIVPDIGPDQIRCEYPESMRDSIGRFFDKRVVATGTLKYSEHSPFPEKIIIDAGGIKELSGRPATVSLMELEGIFKGCYDSQSKRTRRA